VKCAGEGFQKGRAGGLESYNLETSSRCRPAAGAV